MFKDFFQSVIGHAGLWRRVAALYYLNSTSRQKVTGETDVIVSLTSHGKRIHNVWQTIECIANAPSRPKRIILWLGINDKESSSNKRLERLQNRGLEIRFVEDLGPHTKYFHALDECINESLPLVTVDDDVLYLPWFLQKLYEAYLTAPEAIHCFRARKVEFNKDGSIAPYSTWAYVNNRCKAVGPFFTGVGGVLYPIQFLKPLRNQGKEFTELCPKADDIWLNFIAIKTNTLVHQVFDTSIDFAVSPRTQKTTLWSENSVEGNDQQMRSTFDCSALNKLKELSHQY